MDYGKLCKEILDLDPKIRYAGVCDDTGETKFGGQSDGIENFHLKRPKDQTYKHWLDGPYAIRFLPRLEREDTLWRNMKRLNA
jgi:hypothetical protein